MKFGTFLTAACVVLAMVCLPSLVSAQPGGPGPDPDPQVPIDGGLSVLIAAGIGYAAKKAHDKRKSAKMEAPKEK